MAVALDWRRLFALPAKIGALRAETRKLALRKTDALTPTAATSESLALSEAAIARADKDGVEAAEVQALYSRAVARYTDVQVGVRQDFEPRGRTYATVGVESLFPYWFEAEGALFLSDTGDLLARIEGTYDLRLAQRLVLQPQAELGLSAQDIRETDTGSGFTHLEFGLRLRYEIRREFAPYIGVAYERSLGRTADFARAAGEDVESTSFVVGLRAWF